MGSVKESFEPLYVSHLALNDFRSYEEAVVEFPAGVVVIAGSNGRGKTNLVESIGYLSTFSSHRVGSSAPLVRIAADDDLQPGGAIIRARVQRAERSSLLELEIARGRANRARLNKGRVAPKELLGTLRSVVFAPEDLQLLRGDPSYRRRFLDELVIKLKPHFLGVKQDFDRVLRQRAATLKQLGARGRNLHPDDLSMLDIWDQQLSALSASIFLHRHAAVKALAPLVTKIYGEITDQDRVAKIAYQAHLEKSHPPLVPENNDQTNPFRVHEGRFVGEMDEDVQRLTDTYLDAMRGARDQELRRGTNLVGSHRDDLLVELDGLPVKGYASHGELWSSALMLRLAEVEVLIVDDEYPVMILDDVFSELDESRRRGLVSQVAKVQQTFVTTAVASDLPRELSASYFEVTRDDSGASVIRSLSEGTQAGETSV